MLLLLWRRLFWRGRCTLCTAPNAVATALLMALLLLLKALLLAQLALLGGLTRRQVCCCRCSACRPPAGSGGSRCGEQAPPS